MILEKTFFTRKFGIIGQASCLTFEDSNINHDNKVQDQSAMDTQYLFQIPLTTMAKDASAEQRISGQIFSMRGGMCLPSNPRIQSRLSLKASSQILDFRYRNALINGYYAIFMDDLIFYKGVLESMIANQRAVYVPKEIKNYNLPYPDFFLTQETDDQLNLIEINLEDNQNRLLQGYANIQSKIALNSPEDDWENMPAHCLIRPKPTLHYVKPKYQRDPQTREFFIQDTFLSEINIKTPDVQFLDPYIISVEDKTRILVYSSVDPFRYFIYDLDLHFELFVELGCQSIKINEKTYYHHQVCLFLTFDLKSNQHRLECLILPRYDQMSHNRQAKIRQVFTHYRFPYKIDFEPEDPLDISTVGDLALKAQFLQILKTDNNNQEELLVLQTEQSILIYDLEKSRLCSQRGKYQTFLSQVPMIRANENVVKTIVNGVPSIQNINDQDAKKKFEENGSPTIYFAYLNGTDIYPNRPGIFMLKIRSKIFVKTQVSGNINDMEVDGVTSQHRMSRPQLIYEFPPSSQSVEDRILAMSISDQDTDGVSLLIIDSNFVLKVLKLEIKDQKWKLRVVQTSIQPLVHVEKIWNRVSSISHGETTRPRIILTDQGAYIESHFSSFISSGSFQAEAQLEFEAKRDTKISQRLKARDGTSTHIWLNGDGIRSSQGHLLMQYRRESLISSRPQDNLSSQTPKSHSQSMKSTIASRKMTSINSERGNRTETAPLITKPQVSETTVSEPKVSEIKISELKVSEQHYFLVASEMRSRIKRLMSDCNDTFVRDEVIFTSFIGNKQDDDILVFLKNGRFLIFDNSGSPVRLNVTSYNIKNSFQEQKEEFRELTIVDSLNEKTNNTNLLKLLMLNKDKDDFFTAELSSSFPHDHSTKAYTLQLSQINWPKKIVGQEQIFKFDTKGDLCNFIYPKFGKLQNGNLKELKDFDFTTTLNLNQDEKVREMIKKIVEEVNKSKKNISEKGSDIKSKISDIENDIKSQSPISEKSSRKFKKNQSLNLEKEVLLAKDSQDSENSKVSENIQFNRSDFDFFDLKAQMEIKKQIRYFVFRYKDEVVYQRFVTQKEYKGSKIDKTFSEIFKLNLKLRKAGIITQFLPVHKKHHIQFMFYDPTCQRFFLFTWDLQANREVKMLKLEKTQDNPYFQVTRGTNLRQNYIVMHGVDQIYDLHLEFSQNFISGKRLWGSRRDFEIDISDHNQKKIYEEEIEKMSEEEKFKYQLFIQAQSQMHQVKANYDGSQFLGMRKSTQTQLHRGFSLFDLQYIDYILELYRLESKSFNYLSGNLAQPLILEYLNVQLPFNANIVHIYHRSSYFLSNLLRELTDKMQQIQRDPKSSHAEEIIPFLYYSLIPLTETKGVKGKRGLSMVLKGSYGECFELMVQMLMLDPCGINYMRHIKPYIIKLLSYDSNIVRNFLQSKCSSQLYSPKLTAEQRNKCIGSYHGTNSQYIEFAEDEEKEKSQAKASSETNPQAPIANKGTDNQVDKEREDDHVDQLSIKNLGTDDQDDERDSDDEHQEIEGQKLINKELELHNNTQMKEINLYSYDFDGYLVGERSKLFLSFIIQQDNNLKIFDLNYIKIYLDYQWSKIKYRYFFFLLAQIINNILMILYVVIQQSLFNCSQEDYDQKFCENSLNRIEKFLKESKKNELALFILRSLLFIFSVILICIDFIRLKKLKSFLNTFFLWVNIVYIVKQIADIYLQNGLFYQLLEEREVNDKTKYFSEIGANENADELLENRLVSIPIFIIKATNSFFMLTLPMQFLYKVRYLPGMTIYLPKFFDAIKEIKGLILIFITFTVSFVFSYSILSVLDFRMGALEILNPEDFKHKNRERNLTILKYVSSIFWVFIQMMIQLIFCYGVMIIMFIGAAMIKADQKATEEFEQLKLLNLARFIDENEVLINRKKLFENVHYVIHSDFKQEKISSAFNIMNSDEWEQRDKKHVGGRQKRKCCASILQGKPIELVYEAK